MLSASAPRRPGAGRLPVRAVSLAKALAACVALLLVPGPALAAPMDAPPQTSPLEQVQALVQPAVVYQQMTWTGYVYDETNKGYFTNDPFTASFQCTGFVVNPDGYIATAGHCVDFDQAIRTAILTQVVDWAYNNDYYQALPDKDTIATFADHWRIDGASKKGTPDLTVDVAYGLSVSGVPSGKALPARVVSVRPFDEGDVALLKIEARDLTVVPLSDNAETGVGTEIVAIGYPASVDLVTDANFNPSFKEGTISAEKTVAGGLLPVYEISAAVSGGMSGGPTVALNGDVIGVNSFKIEGETQPFNFVQPSQNLEEIMRAEGVENTLGEVTDLYRAGLHAYFAGDRDVAIENFEKVLDIVPSHQFAQDYLRQAQELPESSSLVSSPFVWTGLFGLLLLVGGVILAVVLSRRKKPASATVAAAGAGAVPPPVPPTAMPQTEVLAPAAPEPPPPPPVAETPPPAPVAETPPPAPEPEPASEGEATQDLFCPNCGRKHEADDRFCPRCGEALG